MQHRRLTRAALLLAVILLFQSLRFLIPVPVFFSTLLIGSLVNAGLLVAVEMAGLGPAVAIAVITPFVAYMQQLLPLPVFIIPVAFGNIALILFFWLLRQRNWHIAVATAAFMKAAVLYGSFTWLLTLVDIAPKLAAGLLFLMGWPQLITGLAGGVLAAMVVKRLQRITF